MDTGSFRQELIMTIDDAEWHTDSVLDLGLDKSAAAVHIGIFLAWAGVRGLLTPAHQGTVLGVQLRMSTPAGHARAYFVSQFGAWDLTDTGRQFAAAAYRTYLDRTDWVPDLARYDTPYSLPDTWATYDAMVPLLDSLFARWQAGDDATG